MTSGPARLSLVSVVDLFGGLFNWASEGKY